MRRVVMAVLAVVVLVGTTGCLPDGFAEKTTQQALVLPTSFAFAPDGRLFVAEKRGTIQTFDSVDDPTPELFADLRTQVQNSQDHGLLGIEVDRAWPARPYVYVNFSYDAPPGGTAPVYGKGTDSDDCFFYCPTQERVARLTAGVDNRMVAQTVLVKDVCLPFFFHGGGGLRMAPDGSLFASFGDGASVEPGGLNGGTTDACNDPPNEAGSLRSQDLRTAGDPVGLSGSVVRIDPDTGAAWPTDPLIGSPDPEARKIVGYGLRNPYRLAVRPGTADVWIGDVGYERTEEIDRLNPAAPVENYGWPCYEGSVRAIGMEVLHKPICDDLYAQGGVTPPLFQYCHGETPVGQPCAQGGAAISGIEFYAHGSYPAKYEGALFFADYTHHDIRAMLATNGIPDPTRVEDFATGIGPAVDLRTGPGGDLFYVDIFAGRVARLYQGTPPPPGPPRPRAIVDQPTAATIYTVGQPIAFSGSATAADGAPLPASSMRWDLMQLHCPTEATCHRHFVTSREGVASGSFVATAHEGSNQLEVALTVTDDGLTDTSTVVVKMATATLAADGGAPVHDGAIPSGPGTGFLQNTPG